MQNIPPLYYTKRLLGSATTLEGLNLCSPLEEGAPEEGLILLQLDFADFPLNDTFESLNQSLLAAGVPLWPGNTRLVFVDTTNPTIYIGWVKGIAWMPIIIGILLVTVLPVLLGGIIWLVLPQGIKEIIELGGMMLVLFGIMKLIKPITTPEKGKGVQKGKE